MTAARRVARWATGIAAAVALASTGALPAAAWAAVPSPVASFDVSPTVFSPRAVGAPRRAIVRVRLSATAKVVCEVRSRSGALVRTLMNAKAAKPRTYSLAWDGRTGTKQRAADGSYSIRLVAARKGRRVRLARRVRVDATAPGLVAVSVGPSPFWPDGDGYADKLRIAVRVSGGSATVVTRISAPGGLSVRWTDTTTRTVRHTWGGVVGARRAGYGRLVVRVTARDSVGNVAARSAYVAVSPYRDLGRVNAELRGAILAAVKRRIAVARGGFFSADSRGDFSPTSGADRGDLAMALVRAFDVDVGDSTARRFTDIATDTALARAAATVVAHGWMGDYATTDGRAFKPDSPATTAIVARAFTRALGMRSTAARIQSQDPGTPWWGGDTVVMQNLKLRRRGARVHPRSAYPRAELAYSLVAAIALDSGQKKLVADQFAGSKLISQSERQRAFTSGARGFLGEPYVWGGDALSEGGFDCSGLLYHVAGKLGVGLQRTAAQQAADGRYRAVSAGALAPGDGVYFASSGGSRVSHAGMYLGDGYFIHSSGSRNGVSIDRLTAGSYWRRVFVRGRRYIPVLELWGWRVTPTVFSPDGDGTRDSVSVTFRITKDASLVCAVYDPRGSRVRTLLSAKRAAGTVNLAWDGSTGSGRAPDGSYRVRLSAVDAERNRRTAYTTVRLDTTAPVLSAPSVTPDPMRAREGTATFSVVTNEACDLTLEIRDAGDAVVVQRSVKAAAPGGAQVPWDGRDSQGRAVGQDAYRFRFMAVDAAGNRSETEFRSFAVR